MQPTSNSNSTNCGTPANPSPSYIRTAFEPKLSALEDITPVERRNRCLVVVRSPTSTLAEKELAFRELQTLASKGMQQLLTIVPVDVESASGYTSKWVSFRFSGIELSRVRVDDGISALAPTTYLPAATMLLPRHPPEDDVNQASNSNEKASPSTTINPRAELNARVASGEISADQARAATPYQLAIISNAIFLDYLDIQTILNFSDPMCKNLLACTCLMRGGPNAAPKRVIEQITRGNYTNSDYYGRPLLDLSHPIPSLICNGVISADDIEKSTPLKNALAYPYVARCLIQKIITLDEVNAITDTLNNFKDMQFSEARASNFAFYARVYDYLHSTLNKQFQRSGLEDRRKAMKEDAIEGFFAHAMALHYSGQLTLVELLVFIYNLKHIIHSYGMNCADLNADFMNKIFDNKELLSELIQLKTVKCLKHEQLTLTSVLGWPGWTDGEINNLMVCFNSKPKMIELIIDRRIHPLYLAGLNSQEMNNLENCLRHPELVDLMNAGKLSVEDMIALTPQKIIAILVPEVYKFILTDQITARRASIMSESQLASRISELQRENSTQPRPSLSSRFSSFFNFKNQ